MTRGAKLLLVALVALGGFLRLVRLLDWPPGPYIDEVYVVRAARLVATDPEAPLFGTTPLEPPEAGFVNYYASNVYLRFVAVVDALAGGGMPTFRAVSVGPAFLLLFGGLLLSWEATRATPQAFLPSALLLSSAMWLLTTARWGLNALLTSALSTVATALALAAFRRSSLALAAGAGAVLGLAQYSSVAARLALGVPVVVLAWALLRRRRDVARPAGVVLGAAFLVALPLFWHYARNPGRETARRKEIAVYRKPPAEALAELASNVTGYAALFILRGDQNERHGSRHLPVLPAALSGLALAGAALSFRRKGAPVLLAVTAAAFLAGGLLSSGVNAFRVSPAAPYLLVLAALGGAWLVEALPERRQALGSAAMWAVFSVAVLTDVTHFVDWGLSPRTRGAFGGPERELADAIALERAPGSFDVLLSPGTAARNEFVVDVLLGRPGDGGRPSVRRATLSSGLPWRYVPSRDVLYADDGRAAPLVASLGGREARRGPDASGNRSWALYVIPGRAAARAAEAFLSRFPLLPAEEAGDFVAGEDGLYTLLARGGVTATLHGGSLFDVTTRPEGSTTVRLARGRHRLEVETLQPGASFEVTAPNGFLCFERR